MAATEVYILPYKMMAIKYDPAIVKEVPFTDSVTRLLSRITFTRIAGNIKICEVDCLTGGLRFFNGSYPPAGRINTLNGITTFEVI